MCLLFAMAFEMAHAQNIIISGEVRDRETNIYLPKANCKIFDINGVALDSVTTGGYQQTGNGYIALSDFNFSIPKKEGTYRLQFSFPEFDTVSVNYELRQIGSREIKRSIGTIYMNRHREHTLNEVTVTASKVKFYHKGDTIVYNADAFNLSEGSMLDALIGALPGVEVREGGQIYVNGRFVESLLLDGKDFFKGNNEIMLNNLGAYTVKDIRVYEKSTELAQFIGNDLAEDKEYVMDVKLKQEFKGGTILNIEAGGGSDDRYLGRLFGLRFSGDNRFTLLGNANNLAAKSRLSRQSSYSLLSSPSDGEMSVYDGGFDYNATKGRKQFQGDAYITGTKSTLNSTSSSINYLQQARTFSYAKSHTATKSLSAQTKHKITGASDHFRYDAQGAYTFTKNDASQSSAAMLTSKETAYDRWNGLVDRINQGNLTVAMRDSLINQALTITQANNYRSNFTLKGNAYITFDRIPDYIGLTASGGYENFHSQSTTERLINYGDAELKGLGERQRLSNRPNSAYWGKGGVNYTYMPRPNFLMQTGYYFQADHKEQTSNLFSASILADATGRFDLLSLREMQETYMPSNSYKSTLNDITQSVAEYIAWAPNKFMRIESTFNLMFMRQHIDYRRGDAYAAPTRHSFGISSSPLSLNWTTKYNPQSKLSDKLRVNYTIETQKPDLVKTIDFVDDIDPLNVFLGNPGLKNSWRHSIYANYTIGSHKGKTFVAMAQANITDNDLVSGYWLNPESGQRRFKTYNVDGNYDMLLYLDFSAQLSSKFSYRGKIIENYYHYSGMYGEGPQAPALQKSHALHTATEHQIDFTPGKHSIGLHLYGVWRREITPNMGAHNMGEINADLEAFFSLPFGFELESTFCTLTRIGYANPALNKLHPLWNASLSKTFDKGKWLVSLHAYDILNKINNVVATMNANGRVETHYSYIPRYVLATVQFRYSHTPSKQAPQIRY